MAEGTPLQKVYDAFLARISSDEWILPEEEAMAKEDWRMLLDMAIFRFRFPRIGLEIAPIEVEEPQKVNGNGPENEEQTTPPQEQYFVNPITQREIQVLAIYMKHEWIKRCIASWEEVRMLYSSKDFSQANHLDKLIKASDQIEKECNKAAATYSRSVGNEPFNYTVFAGGANNHGNRK